MSKRISTEARILDWIDTAPIAVVTSIMGIANARYKARVNADQPAVHAPRKARADKGTQRKRTNAGATQTVPGTLVTGAIS